MKLRALLEYEADNLNALSKTSLDFCRKAWGFLAPIRSHATLLQVALAGSDLYCPSLDPSDYCL